MVEIEGIAGATATSVHEGADTRDAFMQAWNPPLSSFDESYSDDKETLTARAQDTIRNVSYVAGAVRAQISKTVGDNYRISYEPNTSDIGFTDAELVGFVESVEQVFEADAMDDECWFDASGRMNMTELCACAMYAHYGQGEAMLMGEYQQRQRDKGNRPFASTVSIINTDRIVTPPMMIESKRRRLGFQRDGKGYATGAYVLNEHPGDFMYLTDDPMAGYKFIPRHTAWRRERWKHLFVTEAADQTRGRSQLASGLMDSRMLAKFKKAVLSNAITQGLYAAVIESADPVTAFQGLMATDPKQIGDERMRLMAQKEAHYGDDRQLQMSNAVIPHMMPGDKLSFTAPNSTLDMVDPFAAVFYRDVARTLDVSYEELTGDHTKTNFAGTRAGEINSEAGRRTLEARVPAPAAKFMFRTWLEEMCAMGRIKGVPGRTSRARVNWFLNHKQALTQVSFYGPGVRHSDVVKGTKGAMNEMRMRVLTRKDYCHTYSDKSWRKQMNQIALEQKEAKMHGIELDGALGVDTEASVEVAQP